MALIASLASLSGALIFGIFCAGLGHRILRGVRVEFENALEQLLCSVAAGVIAYETAVAVFEFVTRPGLAVFLALAVLVLTGAFGFLDVWRILAGLVRRIQSGSRPEHLLAAVTCFVALFAGMAAVAPLTGSDALHYHFTSPLLVLRDGFVPHFSLVNSFFTGQGHLLILTGLALHSEQLSLALIFLGGLLAAAAGACLARQWLSREWAWLCGLSFLLTPVVFWQMSTAGAPDIWMAFFATTGVLVVARARKEDRFAVTMLAGAMAGALAGAKYTGCFFAAALLLAFLVETRSLRRLTLFFCAALAVGIWPYARNTLWTHDPVFPFLLHWFAPTEVNSFTLGRVLADTGASGRRSLWQVFLFPLFAGMDRDQAGFWQFFGPLPFAFALPIFLAWRKTPLWRVVSIVWLASSALIVLSSGMLRFLLPVFPVALAVTFAGAAYLQRSDWRIARALSFASIGALLVLSMGGALFYGRSAAEASIGLLSRDDYLKQRAPDYGRVSFINQASAGQGSEAKTLVFLQHLYYLRVPFVPGDPGHNWNIDPQRYASAEAWNAFFRAEKIRWVVRAPDYPREVAAPLQKLEAEGRLIPVARGDVSDFDGMRLLGARKTTPVVILRVKE
jgi:hypothetical protein